MKLCPNLLPGTLAGLVLGLALAGCGGGASTDKPAAAAAQVTPVSEAASGVVAAAAATAASEPATAASAASAAASEPALVKAQAADEGRVKVATATAGAMLTTTPVTTTPSTTGTSTSAGSTVAASPAWAISAPTTGGAATTPTPAAPAVEGTSGTATQTASGAAGTGVQPDAAVLGTAASLTGLSSVNANQSATTTVSTVTANCKVAYAPPASLTLTTAAARPAAGGVFYTNAELVVWKARLTSGPFLKAGDFTKGSPGDWDRINQNAATFLKNGDKGPQLTSAPDEFSRLGAGARDAAFLFLMTADGKVFTAVRDYLLAQVKNPAVDFPATLCLTDKNNWTPDGYFYQSGWLLRYVVTYDFVRSAISTADRVTIENFIRRNAYTLATQMDAALLALFPNRLKGDYSKRLWVATTSNGAVSWWSKRYDTNGDCKVDSSDAPNAAPVYAYVNADGVLGPRITELSQFYNNRRAVTALSYGAAGLVLGDSVLIASAKRYTFEWLTYGVWPDGSQGEYARNGDYCIPQQGVIYGAANTASAALLATLLTRQGDTSIQSFSTRDGLFGTEVPASAPAKTLELAVQTQLGLINGSQKWYFHQPWRAKQDFTDANAMTGFRSYYMKSTTALENYHELGLLPAAKLLPNANIAGIVLRDKAITALPFPGATGNSVTTGWGNWNDSFNALPAVLLIRP